MARVVICLTGLVSIISSLGCCCPAALRPGPIVLRPPPVVIAPPPIIEPKPAEPQPAAPPAVAGKARTFDLIPIIDLRFDVVDGDNKWEIKDGKLVCKEGNFVPRVQIPYAPPQEYDFTVTFSQPGFRNGISLIMPKPDGKGMYFWYLGNNDGAGFGFGGENENNKGGEIPKLLQLNKTHVTMVQVRRTGVTGALDAKLLKEYRTDYRDLNIDGWRRMKNEQILGVACDDPTTFHRITIKEITGTGKATR